MRLAARGLMLVTGFSDGGASCDRWSTPLVSVLRTNRVTFTHSGTAHDTSPQPGPMHEVWQDRRRGHLREMCARLTQSNPLEQRPADQEPLTHEIVQSDAASDDVAAKLTEAERHRLLLVETLDLLDFDQRDLDIRLALELLGERARAGVVAITDDAPACLQGGRRDRHGGMSGSNGDVDSSDGTSQGMLSMPSNEWHQRVGARCVDFTTGPTAGSAACDCSAASRRRSPRVAADRDNTPKRTEATA